VPLLSAGLLLFRSRGHGLEVLIGHPGGPFWAHRADGAWSIPKGEYGAIEDSWQAALREFAKELGCLVPPGTPLDLGVAEQRGGKVRTVFALSADLDISRICSNTFTLE